MAELILDRAERLSLRGDAHHLEPVVLLGSLGFSDAVLKEIDRALNDHGLIKIHVPTDDREEREEIYHTVADQLGAARIQMIGKMLVFYRPQAEEMKKAEQKPVNPLLLSARADPGARGVRKPAEGDVKKKKAGGKTTVRKAITKKGGKVVIKARQKHKHLTKKAALS